MSEYTPTTDEIRSVYDMDEFLYPAPLGQPCPEFDRWLAQHDADVAKAERERILALVESLFSDSHWGEDVGIPCDCGQVTPLQIENVIALIKGENE